MSSPDRPDDKSGKGPAGAASAPDESSEPLERSPRGRFVIRSSSHPPRSGEDSGDARDVSGARSLPRSEPAPAEDEGRPKRSTPAERPRRRKQIALERTLRDTLPARPQSLRTGRDRNAPEEPSTSDYKSDEEADAAARLLVISAHDELTPANSAPPVPPALEPPPPAGYAAVVAVQQSRGPEPLPDKQARPNRMQAWLWLAISLVAAATLWAILRG